jgi:hypothetical protein
MTVSKENKKLLAAILLTAIATFVVVQFGSPFVQTALANPGAVKTTGPNGEGVSTAEMILTYSDGTTARVKSTDSAQQLFSIAESSSGKTVTSINTNLNMIPTYSGTISSYSIVAGTFTMSIKDNSNGGTIMSGSASVQTVSPLPTLQSGHSVIICSSTANGNTAPFYGVTYTVGHTYTLNMHVSGFKIQGTFSDGKTFGPVQAPDADINWGFTYTSDYGFSSVSVSFALSAS